MQMSLFDKVYDQGLHDVAAMDGYERTQFMNDIYNDYKMCKDLRQTRMEAFYLELLTKLIKDYGN
ncbi:MAG: hypothetical protein CME98_18695 [Hyphomonas sp.]|jgi:hypothetical protein|nr:hypothetical protein [Hyphomonas sp.]|tara:strand:+ start:82 stop:276 length:195 start_codon:yes stop_codon:yes gene_type:complete